MSAELSEPWYEAAFGQAYPLVYPHRDLASARREMRGLFGPGTSAVPEGPVLDLACGAGRHTIAALELGQGTFGLDLSPPLLGLAVDAEGGVLAGRVARGDVRHLPFRSGAFGAVLMLFSSFGYFDEEGNAAVLAGIARILRKDGIMVLDLMNAERIRRELVPVSETRRGGLVIHEERALSPDGSRVTKDVRIERGQGDQRLQDLVWREDVRLYGPDEIVCLLRKAGLGLEGVQGDFDGAPFEDGSPRMIVRAIRDDPGGF